MYLVVDPVSSKLINVNNLFASSPIKELGVHTSYFILKLGGLALLVSNGPSPLPGKSEIVFRRPLVDNSKSIIIQFLIIKYKYFQKLDFGAPCHLAPRAAAPLALPQGRHCFLLRKCVMKVQN
jgi:hypothetical protein